MPSTGVSAAGAALPRIVIVGDGVIGWMAAAAFARVYRDKGTIRVVSGDEEDAALAGMLPPATRRFFARLGLDDAMLLREADAVFSLGARHETPAGSYFRPFGSFGSGLRGIAFHQLWLRAAAAGDCAPLDDYALAAVAARDGRFAIPASDPRLILASYDYALTVDLRSCRRLLRKVAERDGVQPTTAPLARAASDANGFITAVHTAAGELIPGDLFLDSTAAQHLAARDAPPAQAARGATRWTSEPRAAAPAPFIGCRASGPEPLLRVPLRDRDLVIRPAAAVGADPEHAPSPWQGNRVALGASAIDPLLGFEFDRARRQIDRLVELLPRHSDATPEAAEFNRHDAREAACLRDFALLVRRCECPPRSLAERIAQFEAAGRIVAEADDPVIQSDWLAAFVGGGLRPRALHPFVATIPAATLQRHLAGLRHMVCQAAATLPHHADVLAAFDDAGR